MQAEAQQAQIELREEVQLSEKHLHRLLIVLPKRYPLRGDQAGVDQVDQEVVDQVVEAVVGQVAVDQAVQGEAELEEASTSQVDMDRLIVLYRRSNSSLTR